MEFILSRKALRQLAKLPREVQERIDQEIERESNVQRRHLRRLAQSKFLRLRVGEYRLIGRFLDRRQDRFYVEFIRHRSTAYR